MLSATLVCVVIVSGTSIPVHAGVVRRERVTVAPPPAPGQPTGLTARSVTSRVYLEWAPVQGAAGYRVYRATAGVWSPTPIASVSRSHFTNHNLPNGVTYTYKVVAYNRGGAGPASGEVKGTPLAPPEELMAIGGDRQVALMWQPSTGATFYVVFRSTSWEADTFVPIAMNVPVPSYIDVGRTNGTRYYYRVRAMAPTGSSVLSRRVSGTPKGAALAAPTGLVATPGNTAVELKWTAVTGATSYRVFRTTTGVFDATPVGTSTTPYYKSTGLTNGTAYSFRVTARSDSGDGPPSDVVTATPTAPLAAPLNVAAAPGNGMVTISWSPVTGATGYNVYRGTATNGQVPAPVGANRAGSPFVDTTVTNGQTYFYKVTTLNGTSESVRSLEVSASPMAPPAPVDLETLGAFRLLKQATWGPKPGEIEQVKSMGAGAFLTAQFGAQISPYPDSLFSTNVEVVQEHFMQLALTGPDQLRQRTAWALHKIWVVSAVEVNNPTAIVTYYRELTNRAFGDYRDLMRAITLNPAMGRYLNMLNNRSQVVTGVPPNENYARELMQLFTLGTARLNPDGTPMMAGGAPIPTYTETDVKELARILTGWTFGDGNPTPPTGGGSENWRFPMEAVAARHDVGQKIFLGQTFPAGQTAVQDLDQALDLIFNHGNIAPFVSRQLIQQLVTSNPSPAYVAAVAGVFRGSNGNLASVISAILTNPEASVSTPTSGKLEEPVLFATSIMRGLNAAVTDHPFLSGRTADMGQRVFFPPSVFSYFSPSYRVRGTGTPPLMGPEFQILTSVTAFERTNFIGALLGGHFGADVAVDYTPFTSRAGDPAALVDYCALLFMGGRISPEMRSEIIAAVSVTPSSNPLERTRTALYLTLGAAQGQVDR